MIQTQVAEVNSHVNLSIYLVRYHLFVACFDDFYFNFIQIRSAVSMFSRVIDARYIISCVFFDNHRLAFEWNVVFISIFMFSYFDTEIMWMTWPLAWLTIQNELKCFRMSQSYPADTGSNMGSDEQYPRKMQWICTNNKVSGIYTENKV